jgi:hypothetical protein
MNPQPGSKHLEMFKQAYRLYKTYLLIPVVMKPDGSEARPILDLGIHKNTIHFRRVEEIGPNDEDAAVLGLGKVKRPFTSFGKRGKGKKKKKRQGSEAAFSGGLTSGGGRITCVPHYRMLPKGRRAVLPQGRALPITHPHSVSPLK